MLAKVWKKVLLAICIIACIYNVMHKLVSRTSLEVQLRSVQEQMSQTDEEPLEDEEKEDSFEKEEVHKTNSIDDKDTIVVIY